MPPPLRHSGPVTEHCGDGADPGLAAYAEQGGYAGARKAWKQMDPEEVVALVAESGLQARGRWSQRVSDAWRETTGAGDAPRHVVGHAGLWPDGASADRLLVERAPHLVLEGLLVAARAVGARRVDLCLARDHEAGEAAVTAALAEASAKGYVGRSAFRSRRPVEIAVVRPDLLAPCGDGTAILEALEGRPARPRPRPPAPTVHGLDGRPTWIVDAETCAQLALVACRGADWLRERGEADDPGTMIFEVAGAIERPGLYELPLGTRLGELLFEYAGGVAGGRKVGAVLPGGLGAAALTPGQLDVPLRDAALRAQGSALGRGSVVVVDDATCMVAVAEAIGARSRALACGHAVHCREATPWIHDLLHRIGEGAGVQGDLDWLVALCDELASDDHCGLADRCGVPVRSLVGLFRDDFDAHLHGKGCGRARERVLV